MTLSQAKDEIARKYSKESWDLWGYEFSEPYGKEIPSKYLEEAAELYAHCQKADVWDMAINAKEKANPFRFPFL